MILNFFNKWFIIIMGKRFRVIVYIFNIVWKVIKVSRSKGNLIGVFFFCLIIVSVVMVKMYNFNVFVK